MRKRKIVIHEDLAQRLLREIHTIYGHIGGTKCTMMLKEAFYHPKLRKISARILKCCDSCQDLLLLLILGSFYLWILSVHTQREVGGATQALVTCDAFSKFVKIYPIRRATRNIALKKLLENYIPKYGKVKKVQSDHGTQFTSSNGEKN